MKNKETSKRDSGVNRLVLSIFAVVSFVLLFSSAVITAKADDSTCDGVGDSKTQYIKMKRVTYCADESPAPGDLRASVASDRRIIRLKGWLFYYKPHLLGIVAGAPTLIYNHGHDQDSAFLNLDFDELPPGPPRAQLSSAPS
jgi:hypothetical protein